MTRNPTDDSAAQVSREQALTDEVVARFAASPDERLRVITQSLTRHLHAFVRDVRLTTEEWDAAIDFLTRVGHITDDKRQEFILLSDVLGVSMMTVGVNSPLQADATESTVFGPFFVDGSPAARNGDDIGASVAGMPCFVKGTVTDTSGAPIAGARIEVWAADEAGFYDVQYDGDELAGRAHLHSDDTGAYWFWTKQPSAYPIPHDGPVGDLLTATGRHPWRPAHIHFMVQNPGFSTLITHIFVAGDQWLEDDAVFGVKESLIVDFVQHDAGTPAPDGRNIGGGPWSEAVFNIVLAAQ